MGLAVGETGLLDAGLYTAIGEGTLGPGWITVIAAAPRIAENTAAADVELILCRHNRPDSDNVGAIRTPNTEGFCAEVIPVAGAHGAFPDAAQLVLKITPHQSGTVQVDGFDLTYRDGIRRATVHTGIRTIITTELTWNGGSTPRC